MSITPLKQMIKESSLELKELAQQCNISSSYLSLILNGRRTNINDEIIGTLAEKLNVTKEDIRNLLIPQRNLNKESSFSEKQALQSLNDFLDALETADKERINYYINQLSSIINEYPIAIRVLEWHKGWQLTLKNQFQDALAIFEKALQFTPNDCVEKRFKAKVLSSKGGALVAKGKYKEALRAFRKSLLVWNSGKQVAIVYLNMGTLFRRSHHHKYALVSYEKAIEYGSNPIKITALSSLAQLAFDKNDLQKARVYLLQGYWVAKMEINPKGKDDLYCNIGIYYSLQGKMDRAKKWIRKSLSVNYQTRNLRTKQFALSELINIYLLEGNVTVADNLISNFLMKEQSNNNDTLVLANSLCVLAKRKLNAKKLKDSYLILCQCQKILSSLPPSYEQLGCYSLLKKYYQLMNEPFYVEFYQKELKHIKSKMK